MNKHIGTYKFPLRLIAVTPKVLTTLLALLLFALNPTYGQYNSCYTGADGTTTDEELAERPPLNANCGRETRPETVTKKIKMRFVIRMEPRYAFFLLLDSDAVVLYLTIKPFRTSLPVFQRSSMRSLQDSCGTFSVKIYFAGRNKGK
jgi:hypothetical protein